MKQENVEWVYLPKFPEHIEKSIARIICVYHMGRKKERAALDCCIANIYGRVEKDIMRPGNRGQA